MSDVLPHFAFDLPAVPEEPKADKIQPNKAFVEALMRAYQFGQCAHADATRRAMEYPRSTLCGSLLRRPDDFHPPEELAARDRATQQTRLFWRMLADQILSEAQERVGYDGLRLDQLKSLAGSAVPDIHLGQSVLNNDVHFYFNIDTAASGLSSSQITEQVRTMVESIRATVGAEAEKLLSEGTFMTQLQKTIEVAQSIQAEIILGEEVDRLQILCDGVEDPHERARFYETLNAVVKKLGIEGVEVVPLSMKDAVLRGAAALYRPAKGTEKAQAMIPMSRVGTTDLLELGEALELLAHELGHHLMMAGPEAAKLNGQPVHGFSHMLVTHQVNSAIADLSFVVELEGDKIKVTVVGRDKECEGRNEIYKSTRKESLAAQVARLVETELGRRREEMEGLAALGLGAQSPAELAQVPGQVAQTETKKGPTATEAVVATAIQSTPVRAALIRMLAKPEFWAGVINRFLSF